MTIADCIGLCINHTQGLVTKQCRLVHLHQQTRALGDQTLLSLTRLVRLVAFADYTESCINHMQDLVMKQCRLVHLHQQTRALGDETLIFLTRLVRLVSIQDS